MLVIARWYDFSESDNLRYLVQSAHEIMFASLMIELRTTLTQSLECLNMGSNLILSSYFFRIVPSCDHA